MGIIDLLKGEFAPMLAKAKSTELQAAAKRKAENPIQQQQDYDMARQSILGEFSSTPICYCQKCLANAKAARRQERLDLVNRSIVSCPEHANEATRLRQNMDEVENMRCAKQVYLDNDKNTPDDLRQPPPGFLNATPEQLGEMGLTEKLLKPQGTNFKAAVYMKDPAVWGADPQPEAVLAFRGSTTAQEDWDNNFAQDANNESAYYRNAVVIGKALRKNNADVQIVGHSLGGGLASAAQGASGLNASTYNSSGLNPKTVPRYLTELGLPVGNAEADKINAVRVNGEVLTKTQEHGITGLLASEAVGTKQTINSATSEADFNKLKSEGKVDADENYDTYLHGIDEVIASTEKQKTADETALKNCIGKE